MEFKMAGPVFSIGWFIALLVVIAVFVLFLVGQIEPTPALLIGGCALSRLL